MSTPNRDLGLRSAYDFDLPASQIATRACEPRDAAKLLRLNAEGERSHHRFRDIIDFLNPGDCLVVNDVTVQRARFFARRATGGLVEVLLTDGFESQQGRYRCLFKGKKLRSDELLTALGDESIQLRIHRVSAERDATAELEFLGTRPVLDILERIGKLPLPPYILKQRKEQGLEAYEAKDDEQYQTVYAKSGQAVAAPTAGLHFTRELLAALEAKGIKLLRLCLDVGIGTFRPIQVERLEEHRMHRERYQLSAECAEALALCRAQGKRIIAVGTTVVRSLEDQFQRFGRAQAGSFDTDIFIRPGHQFGLVDAMISNFHLPGSTLMVLVSAFAGYEAIMAAYRNAIEEGYRFYSYGDAMFLEAPKHKAKG